MFCRKNFQKIEIAMLFLVSVSKSEELKTRTDFKNFTGAMFTKSIIKFYFIKF